MGAQLDGPMVILTLAAGGALDRFPGLQIVTVETGASWLAWIMTQADAIYEDHSMYATPKLSLKPSELIRRQCAATFMYDPVAINNRDTTGRRDPHVGQRLPAPRRHLARVAGRCNADQFDGVSREDLDAIVSGNAAKVFGFDLDQLVDARSSALAIHRGVAFGTRPSAHAMNRRGPRTSSARWASNSSAIECSIGMASSSSWSSARPRTTL